MARIDAFLKLGASQGCSDVHLAVGVPPMLRMNGDLMPIKFRNLGRSRARELRRPRSSTPTHQEQFRKGHDVDFSYVSEDGDRFRVNVFRKDTGVGAVFPHDSDRRALARFAEPAADGQEVLRLPPGHGARHRLHRHRQVDHARGDDRPPERDPPAEHHQPRGPDRVRPSQQEVAGHPARAAHAPALLRRRRARRDARGSRRDPRRRTARRRDRALGDDRRRDRPPRARHAAHDERRQDHRPHRRRAAGRGARADQELPVAEPARRRHAGARPYARPARPQGRSAKSW